MLISQKSTESIFNGEKGASESSKMHEKLILGP